jgi:hypothetical protein
LDKDKASLLNQYERYLGYAPGTPDPHLATQLASSALPPLALPRRVRYRSWLVGVAAAAAASAFIVWQYERSLTDDLAVKGTRAVAVLRLDGTVLRPVVDGARLQAGDQFIVRVNVSQPSVGWVAFYGRDGRAFETMDETRKRETTLAAQAAVAVGGTYRMDELDQGEELRVVTCPHSVDKETLNEQMVGLEKLPYAEVLVPLTSGCEGARVKLR